MGSARTLAAIVGGLAVAAFAQAPAQAAVITTTLNTVLTSTPYTLSFSGGDSLLFTSATTGYGPGAAIATTGNAMLAGTVFGIGDYEPGTVFDGTAQFFTSPTPTTIQYSAADDFVGFTYLASDGVHYGYAEVAGSNLIGYGINSAATTNITANSSIPVPEPASIALLLGGVAAVGMTRRRKAGSVQA